MNNSDHSHWFKVINLLSEIIVYNNSDFDEFLKKVIKVIVEIIKVDSCLIYFYDRHKEELILIGSKKPHQDEIGKIVLKVGEGITGWVAEHEKTVCIEKQAYQDPRFKPFKELPEDKYESFLSVPIINETGVAGVINLQNKKPIQFSEIQIKTIESLVKVIASAFVKIVLARKVLQLEDKLEERKLVEKAKGILMKMKNIPEEDAYTYIRNLSMNKRKTMKEISETVLLVFGNETSYLTNKV